MAVNAPITGLPPVTTPVSTDEFACVQGGIAPTKKVTRAEIHTLEVGEHLVLPQVNEPTTPTLSFATVGFYEPFSGTLRLSRSGTVAWEFSSILGRNANLGAVFRSVDSSATVPNVLPANSDLGTGMGRAGLGLLSLIADNVEALRLDSNGLLTQAVKTGIVAGTPQTQAGATQLVGGINIVTTVSTANDGVKMPSAAAGLIVIIVQTTSNALLLWPFSGDNLFSNAVDTSVAMPSTIGSMRMLLAIDDTSWINLSDEDRDVG